MNFGCYPYAGVDPGVWLMHRRGTTPESPDPQAMKFRQAFLPLLAALAFATPAQALTDSQIQAWGSSFKAAGVKLVDKDNCDEPDLLGLYQPHNRTITVCFNNISTVELLHETIAHESVHAAQHCVGRRFGIDTLLPLHTMLATSNPKLAYEWQLMVNKAAARKSSEVALSAGHNTRTLDAHIEREAYALESQNDFAFKMFRAACLRLRK